MIRAIPLLLCGMAVLSVAEGPPAAEPTRYNKPEQERAELLLQTADAGAANLQDVDRAYAYWLVAQGFSRLNPKDEQRVLKKSCEAAIGSSNEDTALREKVELDCLRRLMILRPKTASQLLVRASPNVRQQISAAAAPVQAKKGNTDAVLAMLSSEVSQGARYPYARALDAIKAMPADDFNGKDRVFAQALTYYHQKHSRFDVGLDDLGILVARLWREISPGLILQAINEILDVAGEEADADSHLEISLKAGSRGASFGSLYQYRLFEVLPVLRELDPARADELIKKNAQVKDVLQKYPSGLQSLSSSDPDHQNEDDSLSMSLHKSSGPANGPETSPASVLHLQFEQQARTILSSAQKDSDTALANALLLDDVPSTGGSSKVDLLIEIAQAAGKQRERVAVTALQEASKLLDNYPLMVKARYLVQITDVYLQVGDADKARAILSDIMKSVAKLYALDTNSDDPNRALKSTWPSTVIARSCIALAGRISPILAEQLTAELPDPDLRVFAKIELAYAILKIPSYPALIQQHHKQDRNDRVDVLPIPTALKVSPQ